MDQLIKEVTEEIKQLKKYNINIDRKFFSTNMSQRQTIWRNKRIYNNFITKFYEILEKYGYVKVE